MDSTSRVSPILVLEFSLVHETTTPCFGMLSCRSCVYSTRFHFFYHLISFQQQQRPSFGSGISSGSQSRIGLYGSGSSSSSSGSGSGSSSSNTGSSSIHLVTQSMSEASAILHVLLWRIQSTKPKLRYSWARYELSPDSNPINGSSSCWNSQLLSQSDAANSFSLLTLTFCSYVILIDDNYPAFLCKLKCFNCWNFRLDLL